MDTTIAQVGPMAFAAHEQAESEVRVHVGLAERIEIANVRVNIGLM